ncbi:hypothetical protein [Klebsiella phage vB_Kp_IME328]|uniref:Uncharacterized protein n=1 Tax=Klebsiella phage vB_Kp_IME328 TaxID=2880890 RepID=A0AAE8YFM2_9CAUD|nr:hypothetical protein [Klebsiella phage vB_Kp_IME328]
MVVAENRGMAIPPGVSRVDGGDAAPPKRRYCDYLPWRER